MPPQRQWSHCNGVNGLFSSMITSSPLWKQCFPFSCNKRPCMFPGLIKSAVTTLLAILSGLVDFKLEGTRIPRRPVKSKTHFRERLRGVLLGKHAVYYTSLRRSKHQAPLQPFPTFYQPTSNMSFPWVPSGPMISLSPASDSYPFQTKYLPLSSTKHVLGSVDGGGKTPRKAAPGNGWFASKTGSTATPLTLSAVHAEVWMENGQVYLRDLDSAFGTYVNEVKVRSVVTLKTGDTLALGTKIDRNSKTPSNITDEQLLSITAKVTIVGITS